MHIKDFDPFAFNKILVSGVPVYYKNLPWAPCVHIRFQFSAGAFNDPVGKEGLSHFLEHLIGNGSPSLPSKKDIKEFSRLYMLNSRNAYTNPYWTAYVGRCLPEHFATVLEKMREYVFEPLLKPEDIEHERKVITQEAWQRYKNAKFLKFVREWSTAIYHGHIRERISSPLGWPDTIATINKEDIADYHRSNYVKENLSLVLVGAVEESHIKEVERILQNIPSGQKVTLNIGQINRPTSNLIERTGDEIGEPRQQMEYTLIRGLNQVVGNYEEVGKHARMLLYDILFERLRLEHSLCYGVGVHWHQWKDYLEVIIGLDALEEKLDLIREEIGNVVAEIIDGKWRDRFNTIHKLAIDQMRSKEWESSDVIDLSAEDLARYGYIPTYNEKLQNIGKVSYDEVVKIIKQIFNEKELLKVIIRPSK